MANVQQGKKGHGGNRKHGRDARRPCKKRYAARWVRGHGVSKKTPSTRKGNFRIVFDCKGALGHCPDDAVLKPQVVNSVNIINRIDYPDILEINIHPVLHQ